MHGDAHVFCGARPPGIHSSGPRVTRRRRALVEYRNWTVLGDTPTTRGRVPVQKARSGGRARSNRREAPSSALVTSQWHAEEGADQAART
eukprot:scaffold45236_cov71-Phaeocystis_antarctica.AAC.2